MRKILLVEDEELILQGLLNIMDWSALDMEVIHTAHNGQQALSLFEAGAVDIIITDINMPVMDGLTFLTEVRKSNTRTRAIILTGYDEFDYARKAIHLDVIDYILKPIDEEKLEAALLIADRELHKIDSQNTTNIDYNADWLRFLNSNTTHCEANDYLSLLPAIPTGSAMYAALMKISLESLKIHMISDVLAALKDQFDFRIIYLATDTFLLLCNECCTPSMHDYLGKVQDYLESSMGILTFLTVSSPIYTNEALPAAYREAKKMQKCQLLEGYGSLITPIMFSNRNSTDIIIDPSLLRKFILRKDKDGALNYIEDLFVNNVKEEVSIEDIYQMSIKISMILQDIKGEYKLHHSKTLRNLSEMVDNIYQVEDLCGLKAIFIEDISEIITNIHENDSSYTPVIKQIMSEVQKNYKEDMNLKTLAYKYHMNASYLGQIFQKEVGCSFAQYLSNTKNSIAKDMILNTNMKINDIAKEVGYPDTSYFYRKFKQCFGVSPASLRELKQY